MQLDPKRNLWGILSSFRFKIKLIFYRAQSGRWGRANMEDEFNTDDVLMYL